MTVSESLLQIAELTKQNLQILQVLNDSFYTKANHLSTVVGDTTYTIPSYIALENKVNHVQDAINNLVHAAKAGEAWFNFDGNSKEICVRGYQPAPSPVDLTIQDKFHTEIKQMFKDMLTPQPYLKFDMSGLPDDIHKVLVKKFIPYNSVLKNILQGENIDEASRQLSWPDFQRLILTADKEFKANDDYLEYDSVYELPIRHCTRSGSYVIEEVLTDQITENFENIISVRISDQTPLVCTDFDGFGETYIEAGNILTTFDGSAKLKVQKVNISARTMTLVIMSGEYVNPIAAGKDIQVKPGQTVFDSVSDYSILKLYASQDDNRELHIPLEEDSMVYMTVAPINPRLNTQAAWGMGILVNTDKLVRGDNMDQLEKFRDYYNNNVSNIGDSMVELATITYPSITKYSSDDWDRMVAPPTNEFIETGVFQINKHLNDSDAVKNIRALYSQKKQYQTDLAEVQARITSLTESLAEISFDDMSGTRSAYTAQIAELKDQQNNLVTSINKIIDSITLAANNAEIPLEDGKFHIRGYYDIKKYLNKLAGGNKVVEEDLYKNILGIEVRYRYRNADIPQANVSVIGDEFLFTEWCTYLPPLRERTMEYDDGQYAVNFVDGGNYNYSKNEPKFNQIDIPISQGENVEFQVRIVWGFGHPFVKSATEWSDVVVVNFPPELVKDVQVTTIIEENNSDIETNRFETILRTKGVTEHIEDSLDDQDVRYYHKPESISSGFYTAERRIIPLKDKLIDMDSKITEVTDMIQGTTSEALSVSCVVDNIGTNILADVENVIHLPAYNNIQETTEKIPTGSAFRKDGVVYVPVSIVLKNITAHTVNLFSAMPGSRSTFIKDLKHYRIPLTDFVGRVMIASNEAVDDSTTKATDAIMTAAEMNTEVAGGALDDMADKIDDNIAEKVETLTESICGPVIVWSAHLKDNKIVPKAFEQRANQIITYRRSNPYDGSPYGKMSTMAVSDYDDSRRNDGSGLRKDTDTEPGLWIWPVSPSQFGMCMESDAVSSKVVLAPGESINFNLQIEYRLDSKNNPERSEIIGFNVRNSLYLDPLYYQIQFVAKFNQSTMDLLTSTKTSVQSTAKYNVTVR